MRLLDGLRSTRAADPGRHPRTEPLALREADPAPAVNAITRACKVTLSDAERERLAETLASLEDLAANAVD